MALTNQQLAAALRMSPAPYFGFPRPQPPSSRSVAYPPQVLPLPTMLTRFKSGTSPAIAPANWAAPALVRNGSGTKLLG